jgi:hypothetical protein
MTCATRLLLNLSRREVEVEVEVGAQGKEKRVTREQVGGNEGEECQHGQLQERIREVQGTTS